MRLAEQRRPDIVELKIITEADQVRLVQAENQALPRLDATALYRWNGLSETMPNGEHVASSAGQFPDWSFGINFSVPLGLRQGRTQMRQQALLVARDRANIEQGLHAAIHEVATTGRDLDSAYEQYLVCSLKDPDPMRRTAPMLLGEKGASLHAILGISYANILLSPCFLLRRDVRMTSPGSPQAQPDGNVDPEEVRSKETVAATDELFKTEAPLSPEPNAASDSSTPSAISEEDGLPTSEDAPAKPSLDHDYVRELQEEFEEQEEEGKI